MKLKNLAIVLIGGLLPFACVNAADLGAAAYTHGQDFYLVAELGHVVSTAHVNVAIGSFAVSPDATTIVFSSRESKYGGQLYVLDIQSGKAKRLGLAGNYFAKGEVYSDPDISPDGERVAFAIHGATKGDIVEASGPFAILDLRTEKVTLLRSTMHIDDKNFQFVAFSNEPRWSPDGKRLLLNFESDAAIADAGGVSLTMLSSIVPAHQSGWLHALGWIGPKCIAYIDGENPEASYNAQLKVFNMGSRKVLSATEILNASDQSLIRVTAFFFPTWVRASGSDPIVEGRGAPWKIPNPDLVRIVPKSDKGKTPQVCR
jgi:dipeptidyl aminopeptidase/acylaminoacyl peptidase